MSGAVLICPGAEIVGGDAEPLNMVLQVFYRRSPPLWRQLLDPAASHSDDAVREIAHRPMAAASIAARIAWPTTLAHRPAARAGDRGIWQASLPELALVGRRAQALLLAGQRAFGETAKTGKLNIADSPQAGDT